MDCYEVLRTITSSRLRLDILSRLTSPKRLSDLRREIGASAPNTSSKAKDLQKLGLIERDNGDYRITPAGRIVRRRLLLLMDTLDAFCRCRGFWERVLPDLPRSLRNSIHGFKSARLVENDRADPERVKKELVRLIESAEARLSIALPSNSRDVLDAVERAGRRCEVSLTTHSQEPSLRYGIVESEASLALFTEMLDMALIDSAQRTKILPAKANSC